MPKHAPIVPKGTPSDPADKRIGLTEAFSPVGDAPAPSAPSDDNDARIGLTEAFSPVGDGAHAGGFSYQGDNEEEAVPDYPVTVFFTREGYLKKIPPQSLRMEEKRNH